MTWQDRIIEEHEQLTERLDKLRAFIEVGGENHSLTEQFRALPEDDQDDLLEQLQHMEGYEDVLSRRISRLETASA
jgi:hypothetical protein